jgi:hypothetical protein
MERSHIDITLLPRATPCQCQRADSDDNTNHNSPLVSVVVLQPVSHACVGNDINGSISSHLRIAWHGMT